MTTLLVTHSLDEAIHLADHIVLLGGEPTAIIGEVDIATPRGAMSDSSAAEAEGKNRVHPRKIGRPLRTPRRIARA